MSTNSKKVHDIIRIAEEACQKAILATTQDGDYGLITELALLGQRLSELAEEFAVTGRREDNSPPESRARPPAKSPKSTRRPKKRRARKNPDGYPKFARDEDMLVKIGWSRSAGKEYTHKAERNILDHLVEALKSESKKKKKPFTMDEILPLRDSETGKELPGYLVYLCLAWLVFLGLVKKHGRKGYTISTQVDAISGSVSDAWDRLQVISQ